MQLERANSTSRARPSGAARNLPSTNRLAEFDKASASESLPLRSVHTDSFAYRLDELGISLAVSTYQAGFVVLLRPQPSSLNRPPSLNTHFRRCQRPMGLAFSNGRLALGDAHLVSEFRNMASLARRLDSDHPHDACYIPRRFHITGDIDIHEMAWGRSVESGEGATPTEAAGSGDLDELWFVNTRFSCLCTLDEEHSFVPRWRPSFVSGLAPEDRCHLNGLAMMDGRPRYVTALGESNQAKGWRENKAHGGVLIDVANDEIICRGLSMPHSPRWYGGRLWMLESGNGSLGFVDLNTGHFEEVARLDGFTRGLSFCGPYAFVGLSQVRESAVFSGIPLVDRLEERRCGVAAVNLQTGQVVGFMHFQEAVQEIFAVEVLPHRFPELLDANDERVTTAYALSDQALQEVEQ